MPDQWLVSPYPRRLASRIAAQYHLPTADVPDLVQELLIALWEADPCRPLPAAWLASVATFKAVDMCRKRLQRERVQPGSGPWVTGGSSVDREWVHLLHVRIARLPTRMQIFWRLRYELSLTQEEIAVRLGVSRTSIRWLESRFLKSLGAEKSGLGSSAVRRSPGAGSPLRRSSS